MHSFTVGQNFSVTDLCRESASLQNSDSLGNENSLPPEDYCSPFLEELLPKNFDPTGAVVFNLGSNKITISPASNPSPNILTIIRKALGLNSRREEKVDLSPQAEKLLYMSCFPYEHNPSPSQESDFDSTVKRIGGASQPLEIAQFEKSRNLIAPAARKNFAERHSINPLIVAELMKSDILFGRLVVLTYPLYFSPAILAHACNVQFLTTQQDWQLLFDDLRAKAVSRKVHSILGNTPFQVPLYSLFRKQPNFLIPVLKLLEGSLAGVGTNSKREEATKRLQPLFQQHPEFTLLKYQLLNRSLFSPFSVLQHVISHPNETRKPPNSLQSLGSLLGQQALELMEMPPLGALPFSLKLTYVNPHEINIKLVSPSHFFCEDRTVQFSTYPCEEEHLRKFMSSATVFDLSTEEIESNLVPPILLLRVLGEMLGNLYTYKTSMTENFFQRSYAEKLRAFYNTLVGNEDSLLDPFVAIVSDPDLCKVFINSLESFQEVIARKLITREMIGKFTRIVAKVTINHLNLLIPLSSKLQERVATNQDRLIDEFTQVKVALQNNLPPPRKTCDEIDLTTISSPDTENESLGLLIEDEQLDLLIKFCSACKSAASANAVYHLLRSHVVSQGRQDMEENKTLKKLYEQVSTFDLGIRTVIDQLYMVSYVEWENEQLSLQQLQPADEVEEELRKNLQRLGLTYNNSELTSLFGQDEALDRGFATHLKSCVMFRTNCIDKLRKGTSVEGLAENFGIIQKNFLLFIQNFPSRSDFATLMHLTNTVLQSTYPTNVQIVTDMMPLACQSGKNIAEAGNKFSQTVRNLNTFDYPREIPRDTDHWTLALLFRGYVNRFNNRVGKSLYSCCRVESSDPYDERGIRTFKEGTFIVGYASDKTVVETSIPLDIRPFNLGFKATEDFLAALSDFTALEVTDAAQYMNSQFKNHPYIQSLREDQREEASQLFVDFRKRTEAALTKVFFHATFRLNLYGDVSTRGLKVRGSANKPTSDVKIINLSEEIEKFKELDSLVENHDLSEHMNLLRPFYRNPAFCEALVKFFTPQDIKDKTMFLGEIRSFSAKIWPENKPAREKFKQAVLEAQGITSATTPS